MEADGFGHDFGRTFNASIQKTGVTVIIHLGAEALTRQKTVNFSDALFFNLFKFGFLGFGQLIFFQ